MTNKFELPNGKFIEYKYINNNSKKDFEIIYLHGFYSGMKASKSIFLEKISKENNINFMSLSYLGHGKSDCNILDTTINEWLYSIEEFIKKFSKKKLIVVGSSLGGWLALLISLKFKDKIKALILLAPAIDFFQDLILPLVKKENLNNDIILEIPSENKDHKGHKITKKMLDESLKYNLLEKKSLNIECPIYIIHGLKDHSVPFERSINLSSKISSQNIKIILLKNEGHSLTDCKGLSEIKTAIMVLNNYFL